MTTWICSCGGLNPPQAVGCVGCLTPKPTAQPLHVPPMLTPTLTVEQLRAQRALERAANGEGRLPADRRW